MSLECKSIVYLFLLFIYVITFDFINLEFTSSVIEIVGYNPCTITIYKNIILVNDNRLEFAKIPEILKVLIEFPLLRWMIPECIAYDNVIEMLFRDSLTFVVFILHCLSLLSYNFYCSVEIFSSYPIFLSILSEMN